MLDVTDVTDMTDVKGLPLVDHRTAAPQSAPPTSEPASGSTPVSSPLPSGSEASPGSGAPTTTAPPARPTAADIELLAFAQQFELTARDLYDAALAAGVGEGDNGHVYATVRENHEEYASAISAQLGVEAPQRRDDALYEQLLAGFDTDDAAAVATAAYELESVAVATHLDLLGRVQGIDSATTVSAILLVESRHCTVLADLGGKGTDLAAMLQNTATSMAPASTTPATTEPGPTEPAADETAGASTAPAETTETTDAASSTPETTEG